MDYTPNINTQGMRQPMGPVDQPNWNGGPRLNHNPQVMNNRAVGQPNLSNAMANQQPIIPIRQSLASPELKRRMKTELSTLVDSMSI